MLVPEAPILRRPFDIAQRDLTHGPTIDAHADMSRIDGELHAQIDRMAEQSAQGQDHDQGQQMQEDLHLIENSRPN